MTRNSTEALKRVNTLVYNLKKYIKFGRKKTLDKLQEMQAAAQNFAFSWITLLPNRFLAPGSHLTF